MQVRQLVIAIDISIFTSGISPANLQKHGSGYCNDTPVEMMPLTSLVPHIPLEAWMAGVCSIERWRVSSAAIVSCGRITDHCRHQFCHKARLLLREVHQPHIL